MKIKSMTATFGRLEKARLEPGPGLTLIHAPNEGGKSTWAAFWRAMLYGIDTGARDKKGCLADKNRYQPWSGAPMEGEITLELEGREITIRRGPRGNTPFGSFSAVYTGTQEPVPGLTASNCGELLTGVGPEVFARSAFLGDGNLALTAAPELERRIAALVTSGEEEVSFSQAMGRLKEWKNRRRVNKSVGEIPKLEAELAQVRQSMNEMEETAALAVQLEGERAALVRARAELKRQAEVHRAIAQQQLDCRYTQAEEEYLSARRQMDTLEAELSARPIPDREELKRAQGELQYIKALEEELKQGEPALKEAEEASTKAKEEAKDEHFPDLTGDEAVAKAAAECAKYQAAQEKGRRYLRTCPWFIIFGLTWLLVFSLPLFLKNGVNFFSGLGVFLCAFLFLLAWLQKVRVNKIRREASEMLTQYGVQTSEELTALAQEYKDRCQAADKAAHEAEVIRNAVAERQEKRDATKSALLGFVHGFAPEVSDLFGGSAALSRALGIDHDLALARERVQERQRRLDDLAAQGGGLEADPVPELPVPDMDAQETDQALARTAERLDQVSARLNQTQGTLSAMGDSSLLAARAEEMERRLTRSRLEFDALTLAMETLTQANALLQERFSPELNRLTGQYMARLTGDKYAAVSLTRELEGFVRTGDDVLPRSALYLSRGTADQLYLALRLAVCRLCLPEKPPILLDDALVSFDDARMEMALGLLWELSGEQQMLLFTCQRREGEVLSGTPGVKRVEM